jgi:hypothetical protein
MFEDASKNTASNASESPGPPWIGRTLLSWLQLRSSVKVPAPARVNAPYTSPVGARSSPPSTSASPSGSVTVAWKVARSNGPSAVGFTVSVTLGAPVGTGTQERPLAMYLGSHTHSALPPATAHSPWPEHVTPAQGSTAASAPGGVTVASPAGPASLGVDIPASTGSAQVTSRQSALHTRRAGAAQVAAPPKRVPSQRSGASRLPLPHEGMAPQALGSKAAQFARHESEPAP